jgi:hypothetical protein
MASLDTNFNISPYYDDYDEEKNYHRILFRPAVPIQARELTQLQTILQSQVERFGDNIYKQGTIIQGCTFSYDYNYQYIKIKDLQVDGQTAIPSDYLNLYATDLSTNLNAVVVNYTNGLESQDPDTNILYLKYLNTGTGQEKKFSNNSTITLFNQDYRLDSVRVDGGGSNYSNDDFLIFTGGSGSGAAANVITYSNGTIRSLSFTAYGNGYITAPTVSVNTSTGSGASLTALNYVAQVTVANSLFTANTTTGGSNVATTPVGTGTAVTVSDGIIYQKGHFVRVEEQTIIVDKFTTTPNNVVLGFYTQESVVNSSVDSTLLDNAQGYSNYTAPGAHRLKLTPQIQVLTKEAALANTDFFKLVEFENGRVTKRKTETEFNSIDKKLSQRTAEESGDYVVSPFTINTEDISGNTTHIKVVVGPGVGYVDGQRIETNDAVRLNARQGTDTAIAPEQSIATNYGNYVLVKECHGVFNFTAGASVNLRDTAGTDVTDNFAGATTTPGSVIGTAKIRSLEYDSGTIGTPNAQYRLYLFGITMSSGQAFSQVRSVQASGAIADVVLNSSGKAELTDTTYDTLVFPTGYGSVKSVSNVDFIYRTVAANTLTTNGNTTIELTGTYDYFPYTVSSTLNTTQEKEFIVVPTANAIGATNLSGTVTSSGNVVTGTGTSFVSQLEVGDYVKFSGNVNIFRVTSITNATSLAVNGTTGPVVSANTLTLAFPANVPIRLDRAGANVQIDSTGKRAYVYIGNTITSTAAVSVIHNIKVSPVAASIHKVKTVKKAVYVKLSTDKLASTTTGPWCLGIPDAYKLNAVYVSTSNGYSNTTTNYSSSFDLVTGQNDNIYGLSYLKFKPGSTLSLTSSSSLLVSVDCFTHGSGHYISTNSYPVNDTGTYNSATDIRTSDIPVFKSPKTGSVYSLRDVVDFRPVVANTANVNATAVSGATVDPSITETITGSVYFPTPNEIFEADVQRFLARTDLILLDRNENLTIKEGVPSDSPVPQKPSDKSMVLGTLIIPPYPSLSPAAASRAKRPQSATLVKTDQVQRYTMKDIKQIEARLKSLEYYSLLNTLEKNTKDLIIPSEANTSISRFKNGFFVDPLNSYDVANVDDNEFNFSIDTKRAFGSVPIEHTALDLRFDSGSSSNYTKTGDSIFLSYTDQVALTQPLATRVRNLAALAWSYNGELKLFPEYDNYYDTEEQALNFTVDLATPINSLINTINDSVVFKADAKTLTTVTQTDWVNISGNYKGKANFSNTVTSSKGLINTDQSAIATVTTTAVSGSVQTGGTVQESQEVGSFSAISDFNPFIRSQKISFCVTGLRPGARHYVFFDKIRVDNNYTESGTDVTFFGARPGEIPLASITNTENLAENEDFKYTGPRGTQLVANSSGGLAGDFWIPGGRFFVGQREVLITDVDDIDSVDTSVSKATVFFNAYNFKKTDVSLTMVTKAPSKIESKVTTTSFSTTQTIYRTRRWDPLAQTFNINFNDGSDGCFVSKIDLYFKAKSSDKSLTVSIRETDNGYPAATTIARKILEPSQINVSDNGQTVTTVTFDTPVFIRNNKDYALVLAPDANSPDYLVWTAETGKPDVFTNQIDNGDFGVGVLFISSNDKVWTPIQTEDLKATWYFAKFDATSGTAVFKNADYEFLTLTGTEGSFDVDEQIAQKASSYITAAAITGNTTSRIVNTSVSLTSSLSAGDRVLFVFGSSKTAAKTGTVSNTTLTTITGTGTAFNTEYSAGDYILIGTDVREIASVANSTQLVLDAALSTAASGAAHYGITESYQVNRVKSANSTAVVFKDNLELSVDNSSVYGSIQKVVSGKLYKKNNDDTIILSGSNAANTTFLFQSTGKVVGSTSGATATISSVDDYTVNYIEPHISTITPVPTEVRLSQSIVGTTAATSSQDISFGISNKTKYEAEIRSKSNEISSYSGQKSLTLTATMSRTSASDKTSPVIDTSPISVVAIRNKINNSSTNETTRYGSALVKYISKTVTLADGLDAEDMKFYVTAYKPSGTSVLVYAKVLSNDDSTPFEDRDWTLLSQDTESGLYSDLGDDNDYIEYEYSMPLSPPSTRKSGIIATTSSNTITGTSTLFDADFAPGDLIKIVNTDSNTDYEINVVATRASNTTLTLTSALGPYSNTTATGFTIEKVDQPKAAFKYAKDNSIVRYYDASQSAHTTYKVFAVKIVLLSNSTQNAPKIKDIRALAVSV